MATKTIYSLVKEKISSSSIVHNFNNIYKRLDTILDDISNKLERILNNEIILFSGDSNAATTLSETSKNFKCIEIIYRDNDGTYSSVKVYEPNGKYVDLTTLARWGNTFYIKQKRIAISDTKIENGNTTEIQFTATPKITIKNDANNIYITKVIGYRE